jgi:hypothetical protein
MDVDITAGDIEAVRVERLQVPHVVAVVAILAIVDSAVAHFETRHVEGGERPVRALLKKPVLDQHVGLTRASRTCAARARRRAVAVQRRVRSNATGGASARTAFTIDSNRGRSSEWRRYLM